MSGEHVARCRVPKFLVMLALLVGAAIAVVVASQTVTSTAAAQSDEPPCPRPVAFDADNFPNKPRITNKWLPLTPGTRLTLEGRANRGGGLLPHTVTFTVTDLTKRLNGVKTVVVWDVDVNEGELSEAELAFFAQDNDGNVWNLGEYPEEFDGGAFLGAPNTWIAGIDDAEGGIHMTQRPKRRRSWLQGYAPTIDFLDCATVMSKRQPVAVPGGSWGRTLLTHETSPLDVEGGIQTKYHAPGVGIVQVGAVDDPEGETLVLRSFERLGPAEMMDARVEAMKLDSRGYVVSPVYAQTRRARLPRGVTLPTPQSGTLGGGQIPGSVVSAPGGSPTTASGPAPSAQLDPDDFTTKITNRYWPLSKVRRTVFRGREGGARVRVVSRVLKRKRRVAGVRVAIVAVREFEDGELVERTKDYFAQDRKGRVWYFGEKVDDIENGRVVGHEGQWLAGTNGAKPGLFMPARPRRGQVFEQERAPGVAEDRSKVVGVNIEARTPAGQFDRCIRTRDFAPLDNRTEFKIYCAGVGLVREKPRDGRVDLVSYR
jgi:hypothetical protein